MTTASTSTSTTAPRTSRPAASPLQALDAVSLAELNQTAGLLTRVDRKYLVPLSVADDLVTHLPGARALEISSRRRLSYASTYFDTPDLASYLATAHRRRRRFKVRTRSYLDTATAFLEVKTRGPRGTNVKNRQGIDADDAARLTPSGRLFVSQLLASAAAADPTHAAALAGALVPSLRTHYARATVLLPDDGARLTIDTSLRWTRLGRDGETLRTREAGGLAVVETKSPATPCVADRWLWSAGYRPVRVSKYATGMALLEPSLPANRWHRVMQQLR